MHEIEVPINTIQFQKKNSSLAIEESPIVDSATRRVGVTTMGCKVNSYESELISESFKSENWVTVPSSEEADLYIVNTCTVTQEADRQARREVRKVVRTNPDAMVVVTGCYAQMDAEACADIPGVDLVVGNDRKLDIYGLLPDLEKGNLPKVLVGDLNEHVSLPNELLAGYEAQTRAFIQIQQGCDQGCTFCIIHRARGPSRSLAPTLIKRQVERLAINGYPEIVICGVDLGSYGEDFHNANTQYDLVSLVEDLLAINVPENRNFRIRLSSIDPAHISERLMNLMASEERFCNHLHLSLQSGNTLILKRMKRRYTREDVYEKIKKLRSKVPDLVMSADVMVGFPTENEAQFIDTQQSLVDLDIAFPHIFSYSDRSGTPAARIPQAKHVDTQIKKNRSQRLRETSKKLQEKLHHAQIGSQAWVLPEKITDNGLKARSEHYLTVNIDLGDDVTDPKKLLGRWVQVECLQYESEQLFAKLIHPVTTEVNE